MDNEPKEILIPPDFEAQVKILCSNSATPEEKSSIVKQMFPVGERERKLAKAEKTGLGLPSTFHRRMSYSTLGRLLTKGSFEPSDDPRLLEEFDLKKESIMSRVQRVVEQLSPTFQQKAVDSLKSLTFTEFLAYIFNNIPRKDLYRLHTSREFLEIILA